MRGLDTLGVWGREGWDNHITQAVDAYCSRMGIDNNSCIVLVESNEITGYDQGRSGFCYVMKRFENFESAMDLIKRTHEEFPDVNVEYQGVPNGYADKGDGKVFRYETDKKKQYVPEREASYCVLVDVHNLARAMSIEVPKVESRRWGFPPSSPPGWQR